MKWNFFFKRPQLTKEEYRAHFRRLWENKATLEKLPCELITAIGALSDEGLRNGNLNWDQGDEDHIDYLRAFLLDPNTFNAATISKINACLDRIAEAGRSRGHSGITADEEIEYIMNRVVDFSLSRPRNSANF